MNFNFRKWTVSLAVGAALIGGAVCANAEGTKHTIVTVVKLSGVAWFNRMETGVKEYAEQSGDDATQIGPASADAALQVQLIEDLIAKKVGAITVVPNSPEALEPVLGKALDAGIKVIGHEASSLKNVTYDVEAFDNGAYGEHLMKALAAAMGEEGEYAVFVGHLTAKTHNEWVDAAVAYQKEHYPKMKLVADKIESNEQQQTAYAKTKELLRTYPNLKGVQGSAGEDVVLVNLTPESRVSFRLPPTALPMTLFKEQDKVFDGELPPDTILFEPEKRRFSLVWRLQQRLKRTILDFSECWIGPPTQSMLRARATGRTYVRANGAGAEEEIEAEETD